MLYSFSIQIKSLNFAVRTVISNGLIAAFCVRNRLNVHLQHSSDTLAAQGWPARKIARKLDVQPESGSRYLYLAAVAGRNLQWK